MNKKLVKPLLILGTGMLLTISGWVYAITNHGTLDAFSKEAWPKTKATAKQATIDHFKKEKDMNVVITDIDFPEEYATPEIYLEGYVAGNEQQKISATVNSSKHYRVKDTSKN